MTITRNFSVLANGAGSANNLSLGGATLGSNALAVTGSSLFPGSTSISSAGLVGIGMTPSNVLDITQSTNGDAVIKILNNNVGSANRCYLYVNNGTGSGTFQHTGVNYSPSSFYRADATLALGNGAGGLTLGTTAAQPIYFGINNAEVARITPTSTSFLIGKTANGIAFAGFQANYSTGQTDVTVSGSECMNICRTTSYGSVIRFFQTDAATLCGSISTSAGATAYNTSSDYRLKENVQPMTGGLDTIAALKPVTYDWIADQTAGEGFIAHELQAVIPRAVTGEKDALDKDGKMDPQGVDLSKIVPHLVAAIQELTARLEALEAK